METEMVIKNNKRKRAKILSERGQLGIVERALSLYHKSLSLSPATLQKCE